MTYNPLTCPNCNRPDPIRTRTNGTRRWYLCPDCRFTFATVEQVEAAIEGQAYQAWLFTKVCEANGSRERAREILEGES